MLSEAKPSTEEIVTTSAGGLELKGAVPTGSVVSLGLTGISAAEMPEDAVQAVKPEPLQGGINGVVWRDFSPGGGTPGEVEPQELGIPGVTVELLDSSGDKVESTSTADERHLRVPRARGRATTRSRSAPRRSRSPSWASPGWARS